MRFSFQTKLFLLFSIIITGIIAAGYTSYKNGKVEEESNFWVQHTQEVIYKSDHLFSLVQDIVLGSRGYVITGDSVFLQPFYKANSEVGKHLRELRYLIRDNQKQEKRMDSLKKMIELRIQFSELTIEVRKQKGFSSAERLVSSRKGKLYMDEIRKTIAMIQAEDKQLLKKRKEDYIKSHEAFVRSFYLLLGSILLLLIIVFITIRHNMRLRTKAEEALLAYKKELEEKVNTRTIELRRAVEELKRKEEMLNETGRLAKVGGWETNLNDMSRNWTEEVYRIHELDSGNMPALDKSMEVFPPHIRSTVLEALKKSAETGEGWDMELPFITAKGNNIWVRIIFNTEKKDGKVIRLFGVFQDITERKTASDKFKEKTKQLKYLAARLQNIREEDRVEMSQDIHDVLGQHLTILKMKIHAFLKQNTNMGKEFYEEAESINETINQTIDTVRKLASDLRPFVLDEENLEGALLWQSREYEKNTNIPCTFKATGNIVIEDLNICTQIFRIYQEALTNIARYAQASKVETTLKSENGELKLLISDDGIGFNPEALSGKKSLGLLMMQERASGIGGEIKIISEAGEGTSILLTLPLNQA